MIRCFSCAATNADGSRFCSACGAHFQPVREMAPTVASHAGGAGARSGPRASSPSGVSTDPSSGQRFLPGAMVAGRYRIIGLVGRGGMGEVYRADDLRLGQPAALKFLPEALEGDASRLERFFAEVRTARQISHPNVCRVHDVAEVDGHHFLSMEFVDGEDLATLLRRIGRLPEDRAIQIARQLCAGLAAAHQQGFLHRDLKPANVMIDGKGRVRITDFGLAAAAKDVKGGEIYSGTPGYMAPEQIAGREVSIRSDLYALGLVLYELFTGKLPFDAPTLAEVTRLQRETVPTSPSSHVHTLDPAVERVILRCLEREPEDRPGSALAVAAALPGGDPLAAALAAGETPSPEMVAAAGPSGGLRAHLAWTCLVLTVLAVIAKSVLGGSLSTRARLPLDKGPEALVENAHGILERLGIANERGDSTHAFHTDTRAFKYLVQESDAGFDAISEPGQLLLTFAYRQNPEPIFPLNIAGIVAPNDPPRAPGDVWMTLDLRGRLVQLIVTPERYAEARTGKTPTDWAALFEVAGLDSAGFEPLAPTVQPPVYADERRAWSGTLPEFGDQPVRIEAASLAGRPVYYETVVPWDRHWSAETSLQGEEPRTVAESSIVWILLGLLFTLAVGAMLLAVRSLRLGRGDRRGVLRLACVIALLHMLHWLFTAGHVASIAGELYMFVVALGGALSMALLTWVLYVGLEPYVRRLWPEVLVSWSRLLAGRVRDPLVGRDVLLGATLGCCSQALLWGILLVSERIGASPPIADLGWVPTLIGGREAWGRMFQTPVVGLALALGYLLLFLLVRIVVRKQWIAMGACVCLFASIQALAMVALAGKLSAGPVVVGAVAGGLGTAVVLIALIRFGLVATSAMVVCSRTIEIYPVTTDTSAFYFGTSLLGTIAILALAVYGFRTSCIDVPAETPAEAAA